LPNESRLSWLRATELLSLAASRDPIWTSPKLASPIWLSPSWLVLPFVDASASFPSPVWAIATWLAFPSTVPMIRLAQPSWAKPNKLSLPVTLKVRSLPSPVWRTRDWETPTPRAGPVKTPDVTPLPEPENVRDAILSEAPVLVWVNSRIWLPLPPPWVTEATFVPPLEPLLVCVAVETS